MITSAFDREILTHYFVYGDSEAWPEKRRTTLYHAAVKRFIKVGLLRWSAAVDAIEGNQPALKVYMDALGEVPFPVQTWTIPK
jgi:hypothetical protein